MANEESSHLARISIIIGLTVFIVGAYFFITTPPADKKKYKENQDIEEVLIGGDFELTKTDGTRENTSIYSKKYKLVYFGFTYCPDICPSALNVISQTLSILDKYNIDIVPIFVTVDPARDTPQVLGPYLKHFHPKIIGYTGSDKEIRKIADKYKVYYAIAPREDAPAKDYLVDHSSFIYITGFNSKYIKHFASTDDPNEIANSIINIIKTEKLGR